MSGNTERLSNEVEKRANLLTCKFCGSTEWSETYEYYANKYYDAVEDISSESDIEYYDSRGWECYRCNVDANREQRDELERRCG